MRSTANQSRMKRYRSKLMGKTTWFNKKKGGSNDTRIKKEQKKGKKHTKEQIGVGESIDYRTVLFVNNTEGGELANNLKELTKRLVPSIGFGGGEKWERPENPLPSQQPVERSTLWKGRMYTMYSGSRRTTKVQ